MIKKLKICGSIYSIDETKDKIIVDGSKVLYGEIKHDTMIIFIANGYPETIKLQTLLHEALHGISEEYCLDFTEKNVDRISKAIYAFLIDNPGFIRDILDGGKSLKEKK